MIAIIDYRRGECFVAIDKAYEKDLKPEDIINCLRSVKEILPSKEFRKISGREEEFVRYAVPGEIRGIFDYQQLNTAKKQR